MHGIHASDLQHLKVARWGHRLKLLDIDPSSVTVTAGLDFFIGDEGDGRWSEVERRWFFEGDIEALVKELPEYKKKAATFQYSTERKDVLLKDMSPADRMISHGLDLTQFWEDNEQTLPAWYAAVEPLLLCLPTEATVERVFNHDNHYFGGKCNALLEDYIQAALQLILNNHNDK